VRACSKPSSFSQTMITLRGQSERERGGEGKRERERVRQRGKERERDVEYGCFVFIFNRNNECLGTIDIKSLQNRLLKVYYVPATSTTDLY
jgi:hypothetical protein